jgi:hypothetical protein
VYIGDFRPSTRREMLRGHPREVEVARNQAERSHPKEGISAKRNTKLAREYCTSGGHRRGHRGHRHWHAPPLDALRSH